MSAAKRNVQRWVLAWVGLGVCFWASASGAETEGAEVAGKNDSSVASSLENAAIPLNIEVLDYLDTLPIAQSRPDIRRAARSEENDAVRAKALGILAIRDPSTPTARICGRALRTDAAAPVRRAAAECLGRLPQRFVVSEQVSLIGALDDTNIDVVNMAGWALARTDTVVALAKIRELCSHPDPRVAALFLSYAARLERQEADQVERSARVERQKIRTQATRMPSQDNLQLALGASWLALYGGMLGYIHGALVPLAHLNASDFSVLSGLTGGIAGFAVGGTLGVAQKLSFSRAHAIVQIGGLATIAGYSTGWLSETGAARGLNAVSYGLVGSLLGNGLALSLVHVVEPSPGSLALGALGGMGVGFTTAVLAAGYGFSTEDTVWAAMWTGSLSGLVATIVAAPFDWAAIPIFSATAFGCVGAMLGGFSASSLGAEQPWAMAAGYGVGAVTGAILGFTVPDDIDPFQDSFRVHPPSVSWLPAAPYGTSPQPLVTIAGSYSL